MAKLSFEDACFQWASNQFLYEELPDEYFEWSEDTQHEHLDQNMLGNLSVTMMVTK